MSAECIPAPKFCPYCGSDSLKFVGLVPRCMACRAVFHLQFSRRVRTSPAARSKTPNVVLSGARTGLDGA